MHRFLTALAALACLGAAPWQDAASGVAKVRFGGDQQSTRIVVELSKSAHARLVTDGDSGRLSLALPGVDVGAVQSGDGYGLARRWTLERIAGSATLQVELVRPAHVLRRFLLSPSEGSANYRYVVDLVASGPAPAPVARLSAGTPLTRVSSREVQIHARKVIVIDAGHGGKDPGAQGSGVREKDVTLAAARALKKRLERDGRYRVVLTRSTDSFVELPDRVKVARRAEADLFISLHADAGADPTTRGATVYTLSDKGSDRVARKVISRSDWFINVDLPSRDRAVNQILLDLTQRATKNQSTAFAEMLVDRVGGQTVLLQHSHRAAGYVVLLAPDVPAVLLEMGFITNPQDESGLKDASRRGRLMGAVGDAIDEYFATQRQYASR